jgi:radical SAM superfamily enzyme YgiQ (UPF0313 family)
MRYISRIEPLGLEYIGATVSAEHDVRLVDMLVRPSDLATTLKTFRPDVVGVTTEAVRVEPALDVLRTVRQVAPECLTVVGGQHPTLYPLDFDDPVVDLVVQGEGVESFPEICATRNKGGGRFDHVRGLMIRTPDGLKATDPRPIPTTLDNQPLPDRSLTARYRRSYYYITEPSAAGVRTSFGCPYGCSFCPSKLYCDGKFVMRDPKTVFEEICTVKEPFVYFCDTGSFHDVDRMRELAEMLIKAKVKKRYLTYARANNIVTNPDLFELWARAGLSIAMIGLEALDEEALRRFEKGTDTMMNERAVRFLEEIGVCVSGGFLVEPDAGPEYFERVDHYVKTHPSILHAEFTPLTPFPGTKYYEQEKHNVITRDWQVYDMQHFVVKTRLPVEELYRLMVKSYEKIVWRVIAREKLWIPLWGIHKNKIRIGLGLLANKRALRQAHRHVAETATPPAGESSPAPTATIPAGGQWHDEQHQDHQGQHAVEVLH